MDKYSISCMCIYYNTIAANSMEEAVEQFEASCPYDIDGSLHVRNINTWEEWDV